MTPSGITSEVPTAEPIERSAAGGKWQWRAVLCGCALLVGGTPAIGLVIYLVAALAQLTAGSSPGAEDFLHGERLLISLRLGAVWVGLAAGYSTARRASAGHFRQAMAAAGLAILVQALVGQFSAGPLTFDPWTLPAVLAAVAAGAFFGSPARQNPDRACTSS